MSKPFLAMMRRERCDSHGAPPLDAVELGFVGMGLTLLPIMVFTYMRANAQRDAAQRDMEARGVKIEYSTEELRKMGNQAPDFRYTL